MNMHACGGTVCTIEMWTHSFFFPHFSRHYSFLGIFLIKLVERKAEFMGSNCLNLWITKPKYFIITEIILCSSKFLAKLNNLANVAVSGAPKMSVRRVAINAWPRVNVTVLSSPVNVMPVTEPIRNYNTGTPILARAKGFGLLHPQVWRKKKDSDFSDNKLMGKMIREALKFRTSHGHTLKLCPHRLIMTFQKLHTLFEKVNALYLYVSFYPTIRRPQIFFWLLLHGRQEL